MGTYIALAVVAKVAAGGTSWRNFGAWVEKTSLARVLALPKNLPDSQNFWDAFDRALPEAVRRRDQEGKKEPVLDDEIVLKMEEAIVRRMLAKYPIDLSTLLLDHTNFFTYAAAENPSLLLRAGHNKAGRHDKRQVLSADRLTYREHLGTVLALCCHYTSLHLKPALGADGTVPPYPMAEVGGCGVSPSRCTPCADYICTGCTIMGDPP